MGKSFENIIVTEESVPQKATLQLFESGLERILNAQQLDYIVPINNASYHVYNLLAGAKRSRFPHPVRLPNSLLYSSDDSVRLGIFTSELEYGRSLVQLANNIPEPLIEKATAITLLANNAKYAREERRRGIEHLKKTGQVSASTCHFLEAAFRKETQVAAVSSERFHRGIGLLRRMVTSSLLRPFNGDATILDLAMDWEPNIAPFMELLTSMGILVSIGRGSNERLSLITPTFFGRQELEDGLKVAGTIQHFFHKVRIYIDYSERTVTVAPMVFLSLRLTVESAQKIIADSKDQLLRTIVQTFEESLRTDLTTSTRMLALYDIISLWADLRLGAAFQNYFTSHGIDVRLTPNSETHVHYYGNDLARVVENADFLGYRLHRKVAAAKTRSRLDFSASQWTPNASAVALIKSAIATHYENTNDPNTPRTCWNRCGLTFGDLRRITGLPSTTLSIGIDVLSDAGMTESFNLIRSLDRGRFEIDRAYNSLTDEFLSVLAISVWTFANLKRESPVRVSTAAGAMHKVLCFIHYMQGLHNCEVLYNRYGKTIRLVADRAKGQREHLGRIVKQNEKYFSAQGPHSQIVLTEDALNRDWTTHLVSPERVHGLINLAARFWGELAAELAVRQSKREVPRKRKPLELFSAFIDCIGETGPELGTATIAHLLELGVSSHSKQQQNRNLWFLDDAAHKVRVLNHVLPILYNHYINLFGRRKFESLVNELLARYAVLPPNSQILRLLDRTIHLARGEDGIQLTTQQQSRIVEIAELFKPQVQHSGNCAMPQRPPTGYRGYVVFLDLLNMKKLTKLNLGWPESTAVQIVTSWAAAYRAVSCRTVIDGVIVCFGDLFDAIRFCVGSYVHVEDVYAGISTASGIETGIIVGIAEGDVKEYETLVGREITGSTIASAVVVGKVRGTVNIAMEIAHKKSADFKTWGLEDYLSVGTGAALLDARSSFESLFLQSQL